MRHTKLLHEEYDAKHPPGFRDYLDVSVADVLKAVEDLGLSKEWVTPTNQTTLLLDVYRPKGSFLCRVHMVRGRYHGMKFRGVSVDYYQAAFLIYIGRGTGEVLRRDVWFSAKAHGTRLAVRDRGDQHGTPLAPLISKRLNEWICYG